MASAHPRRGGPSTAVRAMAEALADSGHSVTITSHDDSLTQHGDVRWVNGVEYRRFKLNLPKLQYSSSYGNWLRKNVAAFDMAVVHSLFLPHTTQAGRALRKARIPFAIRPHGSLNDSDMRRKHLLKALYLRTAGRATLANAKFIFCTSQQEAEMAARWGRTVVIPLGAVAPEAPARGRELRRYSAVFIGRMTEKKGIEIFLDAISLLTARFPQRRYLIAGPDDEARLERSAELVSKLKADGVLEVRGYIDSNERDAILRDSEVFVLPSRDENFGIAVAEALAAAIPVVITPGVSHSKVIEGIGGGLVVSRTAADVAAGIEQVWRLDKHDYNRMAATASQLAQERYSWTTSSQLLVDAFDKGQSLR